MLIYYGSVSQQLSVLSAFSVFTVFLSPLTCLNVDRNTKDRKIKVCNDLKQSAQEEFKQAERLKQICLACQDFFGPQLEEELIIQIKSVMTDVVKRCEDLQCFFLPIWKTAVFLQWWIVQDWAIWECVCLVKVESLWNFHQAVSHCNCWTLAGCINSGAKIYSEPLLWVVNNALTFALISCRSTLTCKFVNLGL